MIQKRDTVDLYESAFSGGDSGHRIAQEGIQEGFGSILKFYVVLL